MSIDKAIAQFRKNKENYLEDLKTLVRIPSISFPDYDTAEVVKSAEAVAKLLKKTGLNNIQILYAKDNPRPYVYGEYIKDANRPTLLLYAHHDVQPVGDESKWKSPPFEPTLREGRLYGRGTADDKAGISVHCAAIDSWLKSSGDLPVNVKVIIEGEEEIGSEGLPDFLKQYHDLVQADYMVLTDTDNYSTERGGLVISLRGLVEAHVEVSALKQSIHSGMAGGPTPDPAMALCKMLATLADSDGNVAIEGIWDKVRPLSEDQKKSLASLNETEEELRKMAGLLPGVPFNGGKGNFREKLWFRPTITINAIQASNRKAAANIINASAWAKVTMRIVPDLKGEDVFEKLKNHLRENCPFGLKLDIQNMGTGNWWSTSTDHPIFAAAKKAMTEAWGIEPVFMGCGGSIPFVEPFSKALGGAPALLVGVEDPYTNAHSENESLHLGVWEKSVESCIRLYQHSSQVR
ncbi:MAG: M20/M25/M40 family metallo-hydrolase [Bacteriovoracaceae bacterium]|nr:M20/M25/M40 family metallo-hydrolase [Bacteriovoracaceae bacterium]